MLRIDIAASAGPSHVNEDAVGHHGDAAWVIDGATGIGGRLLDGPSDAAWFARTANAVLANVLAARPLSPTVEILREVMARCAEALVREQIRPAEGPHEMPSAAFAMVRVIDGEAELTTLADCRIAALDAEGDARLFGASALDAIEARTLAAVQAILAAEPEIAPEALKARLMPGLRENRARMNREEGYWILGVDPAAADHVWQARLPLMAGQRFAVASDGFLRLVDLFGVAGPAEMLGISGGEGWEEWIGRLRALEREPGSLNRFARVKRHDDASLVVCEWEND
ncbi:MAG: protein phosphatase 2C domain-containing protein [Novosphingobium sp.]